MLGNPNMSMTNPNEASALVTQSTINPRPDNRARRPGRPWCDYCKRPGHTKEKCWKLHPELKPHESRGYVAVGEKPQSASKTNLFNKEQLELLQKLFSQQSNPANSNSTGPNLASGSIAQSGLGVEEDDWQC
ncbi:Zinc finger, CCHC-type [Trema orientale]|uniref:Zinc finger, CCHC-type n=1 Tax=Trema orientale TaxID=63057 RepID=A0A2P5F436_TREOI|nr:Zinc finger, CCHC-type [Trema orientale]